MYTGTLKVCDTPWITPPRKQGQTCDLGSNECTKGTPGVQCDPARCVARQGYIIGTQTGSDMRSVVTNNVQKVHLVYNATQQRCMERYIIGTLFFVYHQNAIKAINKQEVHIWSGQSI